MESGIVGPIIAILTLIAMVAVAYIRRPILTIELKSDRGTSIDLMLKNIGTGYAKNINLSAEKSIIKHIPGLKGEDRQIVCLKSDVVRNLKKTKEVTITVEFSSSYFKKYTMTYKITFERGFPQNRVWYVDNG